ncbi:MAG TPA: glutamine synthetase, partial [Microthrixaceae bacterium]|nr:glutamine synthetase [Microthrixaceae bacterium]
MSERASGLIDVATLARLVDDGTIDTVVVAFTDLQGRLMGKRVTGRFFLDHVLGPDGSASDGEGIEACDYLLTVDVDMNVVEGYRFANWEAGYGDFRGRPDLSTLRITPWLEGTALVLADVLDNADDSPVAVSPRQVLQHQIARAAERDLVVMIGSELELFAYDAGYDELARNHYRDLGQRTSSWYNLDYHVLQTTKDEPLI